MATAELSDNATHEEITTFIDQIIEDRAGESAPEKSEKSDAQQIAAERDQPVGDLSAEEASGSTDTAEQGEESGAAAEPSRDWLAADLKAEIAAYGISEQELTDFTSREEVERALRLFDRTALEAGRKALAASDQGTGKARDEQGRFTKGEAKAEEPAQKTQDGRFEIALDKDIYDEGLINEFTRLRDHYESRVAALESRFSEAEASAEEQRFDTLVDALGHADLFGKSGKEDAQELQRRHDLFVAVKAQQIGLQQLGRSVELDQSLVNRVTRMVFAEELTKKDLKSRTVKLSKQANGRMGGGAVRPTEPPEDAREYARRLYKELQSS